MEKASCGKGIMPSCSAGLLHCADCSSHLMDKGKQVISDLRESDEKGIISSCSAGLLHCADCSSHLMDKGKQVI